MQLKWPKDWCGVVILIVVFAPALMMVSCTPVKQENSAPETAKQIDLPGRVVFVSIDTIRTDHLTSYGYPRDTAPFLASLAAAGFQFDNVIAAAPQTSPAHVTLFTGLQMAQHKIFSNTQHELPNNIATVTELFKERGYATAAFTAVQFLQILDRGFDHFDAPETVTNSQKLFYRPASDTVDAALAWLNTLPKDQSAFLWVHFYDPHRPFQAPDAVVKTIQAKSREENIFLWNYWINEQHVDLAVHPIRHDLAKLTETMNQYDAEIRFVDDAIARLYEGISEDSLFVVTGDHGEGVGTHRWWGHDKFLYQEASRVPLIFHFKNRSDIMGRFSPPVEQANIAPTLAAMLGANLEHPAGVPSNPSLLDILTGASDVPPLPHAFTQRIPRTPKIPSSLEWPDKLMYGLVTPTHTYIHHSDGEDELFDLRTDPMEQTNIALRFPEILEEFRATAKIRFGQLVESAHAVVAPGVSDEFREELEALGYLN